MWRILPGFLLAIILFLFIAINTLFWVSCLFLLGGIRFLLKPIKSLRIGFSKLLHYTPAIWTDINSFIFKLFLPTSWELHGFENLKMNNWYLMIANHQSWLDILVLQSAFNHRTPSLRFFMKKELMWQLPILAQACYLLDFPFMKRYSKSVLKKHPHLKGKDFETTKKTCEKFKNIPITIINFLEGTRFTPEKHARQKSPYQNLLKPKAGGIAFTLGTIGKYLNTIVNVTIIYPENRANIWDYFCGRIDTIKVFVEQIPITDDLLGNYESNPEYRVQFQLWLNSIWREKDDFISREKDNCSEIKSDCRSDFSPTEEPE